MPNVGSACAHREDQVCHKASTTDMTLNGSTGLMRCRSKPASRIRRQLSSLLIAVTATRTSGVPAAHSAGAEPPTRPRPFPACSGRSDTTARQEFGRQQPLALAPS